MTVDDLSFAVDELSFADLKLSSGKEKDVIDNQDSDDLSFADLKLSSGKEKDVIDNRDSDDLVDEAESRGDIGRRRAEKRLQKYTARHLLQLKDFASVGFPEQGEMSVIMSTGSFNAFTIIQQAFIDYVKIDRLMITTFNMHQDVISSLFRDFDSGKIGYLDIMLSESVKFRMPKRYAQMITEFDRRRHSGRIRVKFNWNHSKIILLQAGETKLCISGSGNLSDNAQFEQYYISNGCSDFEFFRDWIDREFDGENRKREKILR